MEGWPTSAFHYRDGELHCEDVSLDAVVGAVGTPAYVYSSAAMRGRLADYQRAFAGQDVLFCYALKANSNLAVIRTARGQRCRCGHGFHGRDPAGAGSRRLPRPHRLCRRG